MHFYTFIALLLSEKASFSCECAEVRPHVPRPQTFECRMR